MTKEKQMFPMLEYAAPRRVTASPMTAKEAGKKGLKLMSKPKKSSDLGFHVIEPIGEKTLEYWLGEELFVANHIKTDRYTINEAIMLLSQGAIVTRTSWPSNRLLRLDPETKMDKAGENQFFRGAQISAISLYEDDRNLGKYDMVVEHWTPTQPDLFAKDYQTVKIEFSNILNKE